MKNKKSIAVLCLSLFSTTLISACSLIAVSTENQKKEDGEVEIKELKNISILSSTKSNDGNTITVSYTLTPSSVNYVNFNTSLKWSDIEQDSFESSTWHDGKDTADYIKYEIDQTNRTIKFNCLEAFGRQMKFTLSSPINENIYGSMTLDYKRRKLSEATASVNNTSIKDGETITFNKVLPVYSVGSTGNKPTDLFKIATKYHESNTITFDKLFGEINTLGIYALRFKYNGNNYESVADLRNAIKENTNNYMLSLFNTENPKVFSSQDLQSVLTYEYAAYSMGSNVVYLKSAALYTKFLTSYKSNYDSGFGYQSTVTYDNKTVLTQLFDLEVNENNLTDIAIDDSNIVF